MLFKDSRVSRVPMDGWTDSTEFACIKYNNISIWLIHMTFKIGLGVHYIDPV